MNKVELKTETRYLIECPYCHKDDHSVGHLLDKNTSFGPWYCDECGKAISGRTENGDVFLEETSRFVTRTLVALELPENTEPIFLIVKGRWFDGDKNDSGSQYYYEEGTCPINFLQEAVEVIHNGEPDPHGLFNFMKSVEHPGEETMNYGVDDWMKLFDFPKVLK